MIKWLLIPIFVFGFNFKQQYINQNYKEICKYGVSHFQEIKKNEDTLSLVGFSCVKSDQLLYLPYIINNLKYTKRARANSIYFSVIFLEKKLLIANIIDDLDISYYRFPKINHPISVVLDHIINKEFTKKDGIIIVKNNETTYKIYSNNESKVFIDIYKDNKLISTHWYR
jgi:hypothetical protein